VTQFLLAFQFLSIFPIRIAKPIREKDLPRSMRYYPLVGAVLGSLSAGVYWLVLRGFTPIVAGVSAVISLILFSGALHLDGFADMCDGFYGQRDRTRILEIMKDSHCGPMAVVGVFCLLSIKMVLVAQLAADRALWALVLAPVIGRGSMVWLSTFSRYARTEKGTGSAYVGHVDRWTLWIATLMSVAAAYGLFQIRGLAAMLSAAVFCWIFRGCVQRRIGGMTGDTLGAANECVEVLVWAVLCFRGASL